MMCMPLLAKSTASTKMAWIQASQERVTATSSTLGNIKWIRLSGLSSAAFSMIERLRAHELEVSKEFRLYTGSNSIMCKQ